MPYWIFHFFSLHFVSFRFDRFRFVSFDFVSFCLISFRFFRYISFGLVSIGFISFRLVWFRFVLFRFVYISFCTLQVPSNFQGVYCNFEHKKYGLEEDATFNNFSVISWWSVLLVEETGENYRPVATNYIFIS